MKGIEIPTEYGSGVCMSDGSNIQRCVTYRFTVMQSERVFNACPISTCFPFASCPCFPSLACFHQYAHIPSVHEGHGFCITRITHVTLPVSFPFSVHIPATADNTQQIPSLAPPLHLPLQPPHRHKRVTCPYHALIRLAKKLLATPLKSAFHLPTTTFKTNT